jgi:alginate O-acetyltransferase complex protein AlgI
MLFNSLTFAVFLPVIFGFYWALGRRIRLQNVLILLASYVFYGWWDWRFLSLIAFSTVVDYVAGLRIWATESGRARRNWLLVSLAVNLGLLAVFKYLGFFVQSWLDAWSALGVEMHMSTVQIILPVGISFYTFQTLSYTIDVYRRHLEPTRDFVAFAAFVSFFPQLVAGPIERASNLLPQFLSDRTFSYPEAVDGLRQMLWGMFKKVVIADNCARFANSAFGNPSAHSSWQLIFGVVFFAFQIYGDFSGYSDIAIGSAKLFGFRLMTNFRCPYFSRDIAEFWRRWHISLSTWFRDYVYIPLGGSKGGPWRRLRNIIIIFVVSGFWHGANWTFVVWGALNALFFVPLLLGGKNRRNLDTVAEGRRLPNLLELLQVAMTFALTCLAWVFFRAESVPGAFAYMARIAGRGLLSLPPMPGSGTLLCALFILLSVEWLGRHLDCPLHIVRTLPTRWARWPCYFALCGVILRWAGARQPFIYFQF